MARNSRQNFTVENPQSESGAKLKDKSTRFAREWRTKQSISVNTVDGKEKINHVKVSLIELRSKPDQSQYNWPCFSIFNEGASFAGYCQLHWQLRCLKSEISIFIISDRLNDYRSVTLPNDLLYIFPVVSFKRKILFVFRDHNSGSSSWNGPYALIRFSFGVLRSLNPDTIQRKSVPSYGLFLS